MDQQVVITQEELHTASQTDQGNVFETITLGFVADPVARWIWPDLAAYMQAMPKFARAFGGSAIDYESADIASRYKAVSLWLPPEALSDSDAIDTVFEESVRSEIAADLEAMFAQMDAFHPKDEPCWYLPMIATDPGFVGQGLGGALLARGLQRCDRVGQIAYLESSNPRNITLYQRHGFELIGEIQAGSSPKMFPMIRQPSR